MGMRLSPELTAKVLELAGQSAPAPVIQMTAPRADCSEKEFMALVLGYARGRGWLCYHTQDSRRSAAGFPDLALTRRGALVLAELKTQKGRVSAAQQEWLDALKLVEGARVFLWRPSDWPTIIEVLA